MRCLASCEDQDYAELEKLVVLNPAQAETEGMIRERFPDVRIIRTHRNLGFFPALNIAIANVAGDYIMTVDDDAQFLQRDAISRFVEAFQLEPQLGAATCNLEGPTEHPVDGPDHYIRVFTTGFTMFPRDVISEWVGYYPDLFFRSAGETYVSTLLWDMGKPVKRLTGIRMFHARTMVGRSDRDWKFYGLRSQVLCSVMREPTLVLLPSLLSKAAKSFLDFLRWGYFFTWWHAWGSSFIHMGEALKYRRPIQMRTWRSLRRLDQAPVRERTSAPLTPVLPEAVYATRPPAEPAQELDRNSRKAGHGISDEARIV